MPNHILHSVDDYLAYFCLLKQLIYLELPLCLRCLLFLLLLGFPRSQIRKEQGQGGARASNPCKPYKLPDLVAVSGVSAAAAFRAGHLW